MPKYKSREVKFVTYKCTWCGATIVRKASASVEPNRAFCNNNKVCQRAFFTDRALSKMRQN